MNISDFNEPKEHPYNTFGEYKTEVFMWWFLRQCFLANDLNAAIITTYDHDDLVSKGLLNKVGDRTYILTTKSKGILHSCYGK